MEAVACGLSDLPRVCPPLDNMTQCARGLSLAYPSLLIPTVWCVWLHASFAPLRPASHAVSCSGSGPLDALCFSAVWFCPGMRSPCGVLYAGQRDLVLMISTVAGGLDPSSCLFPSVSDRQIPPLVRSLPVCLRCSPDSMVPACIAPLRPVCNPGFHVGSDTLATLGSSAVGFCPSFRCPCGVLCAYQRELVLVISAVACGLNPSSSLLPFGWNDTLCRVAGPLLPGFPPSLVSSFYALSALQFSVVVPIHWTPSAHLPSGSVMTFAVTAFYATVSGAQSCCYQLLPAGSLILLVGL